MTPTTDVVAAKVSVLPSVEILVTLLKTGTWLFPSLNDIIDPVWIPTFPAKLRFAAVAAVPTTLIVSVGEKPGNMRSYNTASAAKVDIPDY